MFKWSIKKKKVQWGLPSERLMRLWCIVTDEKRGDKLGTWFTSGKKDRKYLTEENDKKVVEERRKYRGRTVRQGFGHGVQTLKTLLLCREILFGDKINTQQRVSYKFWIKELCYYKITTSIKTPNRSESTHQDKEDHTRLKWVCRRELNWPCCLIRTESTDRKLRPLVDPR